MSNTQNPTPDSADSIQSKFHLLEPIIGAQGENYITFKQLTD